ncbi:cupin-like domain-containing protein [Subsaxibacter sp. CAU 1640]|uniref:cupin-like domain-containing protein n=1 Tax=Subsaxibacter sp. CAU 1640 TaxID=2933271 RepID=UPI0020041A87|nr:cupin-like domain-containing protein [Subsaxibacter sp. CAU 1640]MCK7591035.1 cupin-like domain-containing protein [Subsaxibacter sp. CAU 1640]
MSQELLKQIQSYLDKPLRKVGSIETINHKDFYKNYMTKNKPVVMTKMMDDWEATKTWSLDFFKKIGKDKSTFISKGNNFQEDTKWEYGNFLESIERIEKSDDASKGGYLMNLSILNMFPKLRDHVDFSLISNFKVRDSLSFWIGPKGTLTGWHTDRLADNILAQIKGSKLVLLANPNQSKYMYTSDKYEPGSRLSSIDMKNFDEKKFPLFKKNAEIMYYVLGPKEMIFIPKQWWHCVYGLEISISSNNFGFSAVDDMKQKANEFLKRKLHNVGLYGKNCVCHYYDDNGKRHKYGAKKSS